MLALSATAGTTLAKVQGVVNTLHIAHIEMRTEENLQQYMHGTKLQILPIIKPRVEQQSVRGGQSARG